MNTVKIDKKNVKMVAHRGLSGIETENTNAAFIAAGNRSYFGIETDVRKTADGQFVILHDDSTERVAGEALYPERSTFGALRALKLRDRNGVKSRTDLTVPSLEEYIETCKRYDKFSVLELKGLYASEQLLDMITRIGRLDRLQNVVFISFSKENLIKVRELLPKQKIQWLTTEFNEHIFGEMKRYGFDLDIYFGGLREEHVRTLHAAGFEVNCWTVDRKEDAERLSSWGVDYITSNILE